MTVSDLRDCLLELTGLYFKGATVRFSKQSFTAKPEEPLVTLTMGHVSRPLNPPIKIIDGRPVAIYPASTTVQVDLFTNGRQTEVAPGFTPIAENTAEDDLLSFAGFLNSEYVIQWCHNRDIAIIVPPTVNDLTGLVHDTNYEYRAMMEVGVYFTMTAIGYTGTLDPASVKHLVIGPDGEPVIGPDGQPLIIEGGDIQAEGVAATIEPESSQTSSGGGGSEELIAGESDYFTNVEINQKLVKEEKNQ